MGSSFFLLPSLPGRGNARAARELSLGGYYKVISTEGSLTDGGTYETAVVAINDRNQFDTKAVKGASNEADSGQAEPSTNKVEKISQ